MITRGSPQFRPQDVPGFILAQLAGAVMALMVARVPWGTAAAEKPSVGLDSDVISGWGESGCA